MCILYAPVRFVLDFFRAGESDHVGLEVDPRHAGLTPAQWASFGLIALGFYIVYLGKKHYPPVPATYAEAQAAALASEAGGADTDEDDDEDAPAPRRAPEKATKKSSVASPVVKAGKKKKGAKKSSEAKPSAEPKAIREAEPVDEVSTGGSDDATGDEASEKPSDDGSVEAPVKLAAAPVKVSATDEPPKKGDDAS